MASGDRISNLPDDLRRRILYFAPAKEAASTAALARRWRTTWLSSGALNIESRYAFTGCFCDRERDDLWRYAMAALHCRLPALRKFTFRLELEATRPVAVRTLLRRRQDGSKSDHHLLDDLLADPSVRRVEEIRVGVRDSAAAEDRGVCEVDSDIAPWFCELRIGSLPSEALRDLQVTNFCCSAPGPGGAAVLAFPLLATLQLHRCTVWVVDLQGMFDAAPQLAILHLDSVFLRHDGPRARLRCPAVTALVMVDCGWELGNCNEENTGVELDALALRRFRYKGLVRRFSLVSPAPDLTWVDLHLGARGDRYQQLFWQFVHNFSSTKALNLRMEFYLEDIAITGDKISNVELLGIHKKLFSNLEHLELEAGYKRGCEATGVAIANFLHCSPAIRVLRLNLSTVGGGHQSEWATFLTKQISARLCQVRRLLLAPQV